MAEKMIKITINGKEVEVPKGTTILEASKVLNMKIPTLCHLDLHNMKMVNQNASCRVCSVEVEGSPKLFTACSTPVWEGMKVRTDTHRVIQARRTIVDLLLSDHPKDCLVCDKNHDCELQQLAADTQIFKIKYQGAMSGHKIDNSSLSIIRDPNKCILCKRCETMCNEVQTVGALTDIGRGFETVVGTVFDRPIYETTCTFCGQCLAVCPTGALTEVNNIGKVWDALASKKHVVVQTAPAVRVAIGEEFGMEPGSLVTGKLVTALRMLGFNQVFDTNFAADVTIMEEAAELVHRVKTNGKMPILTSCCPGWVRFLEYQFSDMLDIPSTCKSPHEMFGTLVKTYYAKEKDIDPQDIIVVSVMPCVAKKYESTRPELATKGTSDVDIVITTRELAQMFKEISIDFTNLEDSEFDNPLGESSGAGVIFGSSGGVIEAALRTAYEWLTGEELKKVDFNQLRGIEGVKEASVNIGGEEMKIAVTSGLGNARELLENIRSGKAHYDAIEIMACPGGCIAGGGQPYIHGDLNIIEKRMNAIYESDSKKKVRQSHKNPYVQKLYKEFLGEPYGQKAQELLHTYYIPRK